MLPPAPAVLTANALGALAVAAVEGGADVFMPPGGGWDTPLAPIAEDRRN